MASYLTIYDSRRFVRSDSTDTTVLLPVAAGGSAANLSATGGANQFVKQSTVGGAFTVATIGAGDVPDVALTSNVALLNRNSQQFTGTPQLFADGLAATPSVAFINATTTGFFKSAANVLGVSANATQTLWVTSSGLGVGLTPDAKLTLNAVSGDTLQNFKLNGSGKLTIGVSSAIDSTIAGSVSGDGLCRVETGNAMILSADSGVTSHVRLDSNANVFLRAAGSALATSTTGGFTHVPNCAGTPNGTPATLKTGATPMVNDTTGNNLWQYNGAWRLAGFDVAQTKQSPSVDETLTAGYSAVVNRSLVIASGKKYAIGSGARMRIL